MRVELCIDFRSWTTAQHTLLVHIAPDFVKKFVFERVLRGLRCIVGVAGGTPAIISDSTVEHLADSSFQAFRNTLLERKKEKQAI
jgi:hypothetical protein